MVVGTALNTAVSVGRSSVTINLRYCNFGRIKSNLSKYDEIYIFFLYDANSKNKIGRAHV